MNEKVKQILFYTRPTEVLFHIELARQLKEVYPEVCVRFLTFFHWAEKQAKYAGYQVFYMPHELEKVTGKEISDERFAELDRQLYNGVGANFNLMLQSERFLPADREEAIRFGRKHLVVLDRIVKERTLSISSMYDHFVYWLGGSLANIRNGWHFAFVVCGLPSNRVIALKTPWETWKVPPEEDLSKLLETTRESMKKPVEERIDYMAPPGPSPKFYSHYRSRLDAVRERNYDAREEEYYFFKKFTIIDFIKNRLPKNWFLKKYLKSHDIETIDNLKSLEYSTCYYPLHVEPEATILMYSPWLRDQIEICRLLSQALPVNWRLIVKENPKMIGRRNLIYYDKLTAIPNVLLINPDISSTDIILNSDITITLSGTASMEARVLGKPSIALGRPPYLGLLNRGDVSSGFPLSKLFEVLKFGDDKLGLNTWEEWVSGTFSGSAWYDYHGIYFSLDSTSGNVQNFTKFIQKVLYELANSKSL